MGGSGALGLPRTPNLQLQEEPKASELPEQLLQMDRHGGQEGGHGRGTRRGRGRGRPAPHASTRKARAHAQTPLARPGRARRRSVAAAPRGEKAALGRGGRGGPFRGGESGTAGWRWGVGTKLRTSPPLSFLPAAGKARPLSPGAGWEVSGPRGGGGAGEGSR